MFDTALCGEDVMKKKIIAIVLIMGTVLIVIFNLYQYLKYSQYSTYEIDKNKIADSSQFAWHIDTMEYKYDVLKVNGWILYKGEEVSTWKLSMIIQNQDGSCYMVPMEMQQRTDVTEAQNDGFNYDYSGFSATINRRYIKPGNVHYYILYQNNGRDMVVDIDGAAGGGSNG